MITTRIGVTADVAVLQASCGCGMSFAVLEAAEALHEQEIRPRFCPFCAARVGFQAVAFNGPAEN